MSAQKHFKIKMTDGIMACGSGKIIGAYELNKNHKGKEIVSFLPGGQPKGLCLGVIAIDNKILAGVDDVIDVAITDIDGDKNKDIVMLDQHFRTRILYGNGKGEFKESSTEPRIPPLFKERKPPTVHIPPLFPNRKK